MVIGEREICRIQVGTERPRTTAREEGKGGRKTASYQYWFGELKNREDTLNTPKNYQSHMEKEKKIKNKVWSHIFTRTARENVCETLQKWAKGEM